MKGVVKVATVKNYGGRNGVSTVISLAHKVCLIIGVFKTPFTNYINSTDISESNKALIITWVNTAGDVCSALENGVLVRYEK